MIWIISNLLIWIIWFFNRLGIAFVIGITVWPIRLPTLLTVPPIINIVFIKLLYSLWLFIIRPSLILLWIGLFPCIPCSQLLFVIFIDSSTLKHLRILLLIIFLKVLYSQIRISVVHSSVVTVHGRADNCIVGILVLRYLLVSFGYLTSSSLLSSLLITASSLWIIIIPLRFRLILLLFFLLILLISNDIPISIILSQIRLFFIFLLSISFNRWLNLLILDRSIKSKVIISCIIRIIKIILSLPLFILGSLLFRRRLLIRRWWLPRRRLSSVLICLSLSFYVS